jgi:DNA-binding NarL/FixJ family response regulator
MIQIAVLAPSPAMRAGLTAMLTGIDDCSVVGEYDTLDPFSERQVIGPSPDVLVVCPLPGSPLLDLVDPEHAEAGIALLVLGPVPDESALPGRFAASPWGYVSREAPGEEIVAAVRAIAAGLVVVSPAVGSALLTQAAAGIELDSAPSEHELSPREREVLELIALGLANKVIATRLGISEHTVKFHVASILTKLGAGSRTEAVHLGARRGLVTL